jgi:hypothetical protein
MPLTEDDYGNPVIIRKSPRLDRKDWIFWNRELSPMARGRNEVIWHLKRAASFRRNGHPELARLELAESHDALRLRDARITREAAALNSAMFAEAFASLCRAA